MARSLRSLLEVTVAESGLGREKAGWVVTVWTQMWGIGGWSSVPQGAVWQALGVDSHESRIKDLALLPPCSVTLS